MPNSKQPKSPKVFVSHASEDKERFVRGFATQLRSQGIDAWVDQWEILPGDSLVEKIFEEGLKNADGMIIILSKISVTKPWVREELNAGVVKKISGKIKLIPVVIDDCEVPEALKSTVWVKISDLDNYDAELNRIVMAIYGYRDKPPIGTPPAYARTKFETIRGLTSLDSLVLRLACEEAIESDRPMLGTTQVLKRAQALDIRADQLAEALEILDRRGLVEGKSPSRNAAISYFTITPYGFDEYGKAYLPGYEGLLTAVAAQLVNGDQAGNEAIATAVNQPRIIVDYLLDVLSSKGLIRVTKFLGGTARVTHVSAELKRMLQ